MEPEHVSGTVRLGAAGCLWFPSELRQMSPETPALAKPPPLPARVSGVVALPQNRAILHPPGMLLS